LKYIREALEYSDDHMIKHYFCKANTKFMLGRYDEAIKDYTNAVIVYKEQAKNDSDSKDVPPKKKKEEAEEDYYSEKQIMFN
jgi:tetratricopeptide (TPR) repeat protein